MSQYSIAQARDRLSQIVHSAEAGETVELTRRGQPVAILLSVEEYERLQKPKLDFGQSVLEFREKHNLDNREPEDNYPTDAEVDSIFSNIRDKSLGPEVDVW